MKLQLTVVFVALAILASAAHSLAAVNDQISFNQPGSVTLTLDFSGGGFDHVLELEPATGAIGTPLLALTDLVSPSPDVLGYTPASLGDTVGLGSFLASEELIFRLTNIESPRLGTPGVIAGQTFSGSSSVNNPSPADFYTLVEFVDPLTIRVYWEDVFPISANDPDPAATFLSEGYDLSFTLTLTPVPEPGTLALAASVLASLGVASGSVRRVR